MNAILDAFNEHLGDRFTPNRFLQLFLLYMVLPTIFSNSKPLQLIFMGETTPKQLTK
jgi:hypothetical protein